ncbi:MAG: hypothetical protein R3Y61_08035, partial [Rikenellaceae bacterium]
VKSRLLFNIKNHCHNLKSFFPTKVQPCQTSVNTSSRRRLLTGCPEAFIKSSRGHINSESATFSSGYTLAI